MVKDREGCKKQYPSKDSNELRERIWSLLVPSSAWFSSVCGISIPFRSPFILVADSYFTFSRTASANWVLALHSLVNGNHLNVRL